METYAARHDELDRDEAMQAEARNAAITLGEALRLRRAGRMEMAGAAAGGAAAEVMRLVRPAGTRYDFAMKHETIDVPPSERVVDAAMIAEARAGYASGYGVDHAVVSAWLRTWGTADRQPFKEWLADWNG